MATGEGRGTMVEIAPGLGGADFCLENVFAAGCWAEIAAGGATSAGVLETGEARSTDIRLMAILDVRGFGAQGKEEDPVVVLYAAGVCTGALASGAREGWTVDSTEGPEPGSESGMAAAAAVSVRCAGADEGSFSAGSLLKSSTAAAGTSDGFATTAFATAGAPTSIARPFPFPCSVSADNLRAISSSPIRTLSASASLSTFDMRPRFFGGCTIGDTVLALGLLAPGGAGANVSLTLRDVGVRFGGAGLSFEPLATGVAALVAARGRGCAGVADLRADFLGVALIS